MGIMEKKLCPWCEKKPAGKNIDGFCSVKCEKEFKAWCDAEAAKVVKTISEHHTKKAIKH